MWVVRVPMTLNRCVETIDERIKTNASCDVPSVKKKVMSIYFWNPGTLLQLITKLKLFFGTLTMIVKVDLNPKVFSWYKVVSWYYVPRSACCVPWSMWRRCSSSSSRRNTYGATASNPFWTCFTSFLCFCITNTLNG
jgi:hypothetical protein